MSQDVIADALNQIMNAKKAGKKNLVVKRFSKLLLEILKIMKEKGYLENYKVNEEEKKIEIKIEKLNECKVIKPRFNVSVRKIDKYVKRFLPARDFGFVIVATNKGLLTHVEAIEKNIGGCLIAYFF